MQRNLYQELGITESSTDKEIEGAFRKKSKDIHPDKFTDADRKKSAEVEFIKLKEARDILLDPVKRRNYDNSFKLGLYEDLSSSRKQLIEAIKTNNADDIKRAIKQAKQDRQFDINAEIGRIGTFIHLAASLGHSNAVEVLIQTHADVNVVNKDGNTPLHLAAIRADDDGADVTAELLEADDINVNAKNKAGNTALHIAAENNHKDTVESLLEADADNGIENKAGLTASQVTNNSELQDMLMTAGQKFLNFFGIKPISQPTHNTQPKPAAQSPVTEQKKEQPKPEEKTKTNAEPEKQTTSKQSTTEKVQTLLLKDSEKRKDKSRDELKALLGLHIAVKSGDVERVENWLDKGADVNGRMTGAMPLHFAARSSKYNPAIIDLLLERGANINLPDSKGQTLAHIAVIYNDKTLIDKLLQHKELDWNVKDNSGDTPLHIALLLPDHDIANKLAPLDRVSKDIKNNDDFTAKEMLEIQGSNDNKVTLGQMDTYEAPPIDNNIERKPPAREQDNNDNLVPPLP
jgi:ankyrin repeat protein